MTDQTILLSAFAVPPCMVGAEQPLTEQQREDHALATAEAAGLDPYALASEGIERAAMRRLRRWLSANGVAAS